MSFAGPLSPRLDRSRDSHARMRAALRTVRHSLAITHRKLLGVRWLEYCEVVPGPDYCQWGCLCLSVLLSVCLSVCCSVCAVADLIGVPIGNAKALATSVVPCGYHHVSVQSGIRWVLGALLSC